MNEHEQVQALAELDGWNKGHVDFADRQIWHNPTLQRWDVCEGNLPNYLHSRDAIIPVVQKQDSIVTAKLAKIFRESDKFWWDFTPQQLSEILLRATGKWKE